MLNVRHMHTKVSCRMLAQLCGVVVAPCFSHWVGILGWDVWGVGCRVWPPGEWDCWGQNLPTTALCNVVRPTKGAFQTFVLPCLRFFDMQGSDKVIPSGCQLMFLGARQIMSLVPTSTSIPPRPTARFRSRELSSSPALPVSRSHQKTLQIHPAAVSV
jgi:hypothetical protein